MSWSVSVIGKPDRVCAALAAKAAQMSGQSREEFEAALPHILGIVGENFAAEAPYEPPTIKVDASGSGSASAGRQIQRNCRVTVEPLYTELV